MNMGKKERVKNNVLLVIVGYIAAGKRKKPRRIGPDMFLFFCREIWSGGDTGERYIDGGKDRGLVDPGLGAGAEGTAKKRGEVQYRRRTGRGG